MHFTEINGVYHPIAALPHTPDSVVYRAALDNQPIKVYGRIHQAIRLWGFQRTPQGQIIAKAQVSDVTDIPIVYSPEDQGWIMREDT